MELGTIAHLPCVALKNKLFSVNDGVLPSRLEARGVSTLTGYGHSSTCIGAKEYWTRLHGTTITGVTDVETHIFQKPNLVKMYS